MSEKNIQLCRFCGREIKFLYYCEDCGVACCSDCLRDDFHFHFICQDCNSKNIEYNEAEGKKICKDCGEENVIKITQHLKACPKCHSLKILNIFEKKEELEQKFLELIKSARIFIPPLRDVINELYLVRHKVKKARDPPIKCFHFPNMESELLAHFKAVTYAIDNLQGKINTHFRHLALNKEYFFDIYNQPNSNVRIIENILDNLNRTHASIEDFISNHVNDIKEKFDTFQSNLRFIEKISNLFLPYQRFLNLAEKEKPVYAVKTRLTNGIDSHNRTKKSKGLLFITNFDLSFVHEYGLIKKKQELIFKAPVNDLIKLKDKGKVFKKLFVQFEYGKYEFSFSANIVSKIIEYILLARTFQENDIFDTESAKELQEIDLDLNELIRYIEEGINSFFTLKCQYNQNINLKDEADFDLNQLCFDGSQSNPQEYSHYDKQPNHWPQRPYSHTQAPGEFKNYGNNVPPQNTYNPHHPQNYDPYNPHKRYPQPFNYERRPDFDERKVLIKELKRGQQYNRQYPPYPNGARYNNYETNFPFDKVATPFRDDGFSFDYHKNHIPNFFNSEYEQANSDYYNYEKINEFKKNVYEKMTELKKEKFSLKETLKKLDAKFDQGIISEVDYFKTFKQLQKEIYLIDKKIKSFSKKIQDKHFLNKNGFYT